MTTRFSTSLRTEVLKCSHTGLLWLTIGAALTMPFIKLTAFLASEELFTYVVKYDSWHIYTMMNWRDEAAILLPAFVILLYNGMVQIETRNGTWKQVFMLPRSYTDVYFSKFILAQGWILFFLVCFDGALLGTGLLLSHLRHDAPFGRYAIPWFQVWLISYRVYVGTLGLSALQYWMSLRFKNPLWSVGIGLGLLFASLLIGGWVDGHFYSPYLIPLLMFQKGHSAEQFSLPLLYTLAGSASVLFLGLGWWDMSTRNVKG
jgi:hypothetical protein